MRLGTRSRRAVLDGLSQVLEAGGLEDLFGGTDDEAAFLYDLLCETARGRSSDHYWETCRTARRRGVTPEYVIDRAAVLLASIEERRRADLYRILGAPPLSSPDTLRQRYLDLAKTAHPDVGGDPERFRHVKEAYEILRDPERRAEYERFWVRALGPFERVVPDEIEGVGEVVTKTAAAPEADAAAEAGAAAGADAAADARAAADTRAPERRVVMLGRASGMRHEPARPAAAVSEAASGLLAARAELDRRVGPVGGSGIGGVAALIARVEEALAGVSREDLEQAQAEVARSIAQMETVRARLETIARLKAQVATLVTG